MQSGDRRSIYPLYSIEMDPKRRRTRLSMILDGGWYRIEVTPEPEWGWVAAHVFNSARDTAKIARTGSNVVPDGPCRQKTAPGEPLRAPPDGHGLAARHAGVLPRRTLQGHAPQDPQFKAHGAITHSFSSPHLPYFWAKSALGTPYISRQGSASARHGLYIPLMGPTPATRLGYVQHP